MNAHSSSLSYLGLLGDLERRVVMPWMLKRNQVGQFSVHDNSLKYNLSTDAGLNMESGISQM